MKCAHAEILHLSVQNVRKHGPCLSPNGHAVFSSTISKLVPWNLDHLMVTCLLTSLALSQSWTFSEGECKLNPSITRQPKLQHQSKRIEMREQAEEAAGDRRVLVSAKRHD